MGRYGICMLIMFSVFAWMLRLSDVHRHRANEHAIIIELSDWQRYVNVNIYSTLDVCECCTMYSIAIVIVIISSCLYSMQSLGCIRWWDVRTTAPRDIIIQYTHTHAHTDTCTLHTVCAVKWLFTDKNNLHRILFTMTRWRFIVLNVNKL